MMQVMYLAGLLHPGGYSTRPGQFHVAATHGIGRQLKLRLPSQSPPAWTEFQSAQADFATVAAIAQHPLGLQLPGGAHATQ